jgi:hypothetical protein|tara:strand:+ start:646 stop:834 length:189 start_codon:yes stop_codon:yes gene_type:complete
MTYKLIDTIRGKVLQEFETAEQAQKALERQSSLDNNVVELQAAVAPKKRASKKVKADVKAAE